MRHLLGAIAVLLALTGCGEEDPEPAVHPPATVDPVLVHATSGRGAPATEATALPDAAAVEEYAAQFDDVLAEKVQRAAAGIEVGADEHLVAQVLAVGCDVPPAAAYRDGAFVPAEVASPLEECFAPVTTVALAAVPEQGD